MWSLKNVESMCIRQIELHHHLHAARREHFRPPRKYSQLMSFHIQFQEVNKGNPILFTKHVQGCEFDGLVVAEINVPERQVARIN